MPTVGLFLQQIDAKKTKLSPDLAQVLFANAGMHDDYAQDALNNTTTRLIGATQTAGKESIAQFWIRLKEDFVFNNNNRHVVDEYSMITCDGPDLMLFELASRNVTDFAQDVNITSLQEELEFDMRGSISVMEDYGEVVGGEVGSSPADVTDAKKQCELHTWMVMYALDRLCYNCNVYGGTD